MTRQLPLLFAGLDMEVPATPGLLDPHLVVNFPVLSLPVGVLSPQCFIRPSRPNPTVAAVAPDVYHH